MAVAVTPDQGDQLTAQAGEGRIVGDEEPAGAVLHQPGQSVLELAFVARGRHVDRQPDGARRSLGFHYLGFGFGIAGVAQHGDGGGAGGHQLAQDLEALRRELGGDVEHAGHVAAWPIEAGDEPRRHRVRTAGEDDRDGCGRRLRGDRGDGPAAGRDDRDLAADQVDGERGKLIVAPVRPAVVDRHIAAFDEAGFAQALPERRHELPRLVGEPAVEESDHRHVTLLGARRERPRRRAAEQADELAPPCMTRKKHSER